MFFRQLVDVDLGCACYLLGDDAFDAAHLPGSLNVPVERPGVGTLAAFLLDPAQSLVAFAPEQRDVRDARRVVAEPVAADPRGVAVSA